MAGVDYHGWADFIIELLAIHGKKVNTIIDLACGTGASTIPIAKMGFQVEGMDISASMLDIARNKAKSAGMPSVIFHQADLCSFNPPHRFDLAILFQDGLNYITNEENLLLAFNNISRLLEPEGLFIFDLTRPKLRPLNSGDNLQWFDDDDSFTIIWESSFDPGEEIWSVNLTGFSLLPDGRYAKFREKHSEKDYDPEKIHSVLTDSGYQILSKHASFSTAPLLDDRDTPKITFVAKKNSDF